MPHDTKERPASHGLEPEVFLSAHRRITDWRTRANELVASGKAAVNTAKSLGVNIQAYKLTIKLSKMEREAAEDLIRSALLYARLLDLGLFDQEDLFAGQGDNSAFQNLTSKVMNDHKAWEAETQGYNDGKYGDTLDNNPHAPGSEFYARWVTGWHNGTAFRKEAEARGEKIIRPRRGKGNPEDREESED